jgi:hypothetical protein
MKLRLEASKKYGDLAEEKFESVYHHLIKRRATELENKYKHFDFILQDGRTVDVKTYKKIRPDGYVCVEVINVYGGIGWCHPLSPVDLIAFETKVDFVIVRKQDLLHILPKDISCTIPRQDRMDIKSKIDVFTGRSSSKYFDENKDVFTYKHFDEILKIKIDL